MNAFEELESEVAMTLAELAQVRAELSRVESVQRALANAGPGRFGEVHAIATGAYARVADSLRRCAYALESAIADTTGPREDTCTAT
ncbi:MAG: hypothetical protein H6523_12905 [Mycolicibacterium sp.]|nr:hypothetical protein [Mycolicibacterium sp.]